MDDKHAVLKGPEPLYRLTFKDEDGTTSTFESVGSNLPTVVANQSGTSHFVKVERIDHSTKCLILVFEPPKLLSLKPFRHLRLNSRPVRGYSKRFLLTRNSA